MQYLSLQAQKQFDSEGFPSKASVSFKEDYKQPDVTERYASYGLNQLGDPSSSTSF
jgi:hypothetical protein